MSVGLRTRAREKLREWLLGEEPPFRYDPALTEIVRSPEGRKLYEIDQKLPVFVRPKLALSERRLLRCYRLIADGEQCGLLLYRKAEGALFCYEHGETRRPSSP